MNRFWCLCWIEFGNEVVHEECDDNTEEDVAVMRCPLGKHHSRSLTKPSRYDCDRRLRFLCVAHDCFDLTKLMNESILLTVSVNVDECRLEGLKAAEEGLASNM